MSMMLFPPSWYSGPPDGPEPLDDREPDLASYVAMCDGCDRPVGPVTSPGTVLCEDCAEEDRSDPIVEDMRGDR